MYMGLRMRLLGQSKTKSKRHILRRVTRTKSLVLKTAAKTVNPRSALGAGGSPI
jgi:hypothetical protein